MSIQQMLLGVGGAKKTYIDDVFSTFLYEGTGSARSINNGINLSSKGGMVWTKTRTGTHYHMVTDTVRGATKAIYANDTAIEQTDNTKLTSFNSNGFSLGSDTDGNASSQDFGSWTFRKEPGFFDVVTWDGNDTAGRVISHSLGSVPGLIMIKSTTHATAWFTFHRALGAEKYLLLNESNSVADQTWFMNDTAPTSTGFSVGSSSNVNGSGRSYVAYVFAGGESTAATATSCNFLGTASDGDDNKIWVGNSSDTSSDLVYGTGDLTIEAWVKCQAADSNIYKRIIHHGHEWNQANTHGFMWDRNNDNKFGYHSYSIDSSNPIIAGYAHPEFNNDNQWHHVALTRASGTFRLFVDGVLESTVTNITATLEGNSVTSNYATIGATHNHNQNECFKGNISNVRIVKGTAVYTSSFKVPTEPLTNITNTKLLCCNGSSTTSATVTPKTLVSDATVTINTSDSPFDDPAAFKFGENEDQGIIKCGSYVGNGSSNEVEINVGWEPQWIMIKNSSSTDNWHLLDSMRGTINGTNDQYITVNTNSSESDYNFGYFTPTGFQLEGNNLAFNQDGESYVYIAIRRPDGYVGKPIETGTKAFSISAGDVSGAPLFDAGHVVDMQMVRRADISASWETGARLMGTKQVYTDTDGAETEIDSTGWKYDYMNGWHTNAGTAASGTYSWMWKRHAGFDVVSTKGAAGGKIVPHSLGRVPEMYWIKRRNGSTGNWAVYHKGLNGGTNPEQYGIDLNGSTAEVDYNGFFNDTAPTATHFSLGLWGSTGTSTTSDYLVLLFASVEGVSSVGFYDGSSSSQTITTGFQPRFLMIKGATVASDWFILDTTRGWSSGNDTYIMLNVNQSQASDTDFGAPTSTGFTLTSGTTWNSSGNKFLYYAHA